MAVFKAADLIKRMRKQKRMSQEELAYSIVDRATLSKIENGKSESSMEIIMQLLEKLGYEPEVTVDFYLTEEQTGAMKLKAELDSYLTYQIKGDDNPAIKKIDELIKQLENDEQFMQFTRNKQYILISKSCNLINQRWMNEDVRKPLYEAIKFNIPFFDESCIEEYFLTKNDMKILNLLAIQYAGEGFDRYDDAMLDRAIQILVGMKKNMDTHFMDIILKSDYYPQICYNLASYLNEGKNLPEDALFYCDEGIKSCHETSNAKMLPGLSLAKAMALFNLERKDEALSLATMAYYSAKLQKLDNLTNAVKGYLENVMGVKIN